MSVCVSVKVSEGLVLAADSATAIEGEYRGSAGQLQAGILKTYEHGRKLSHIKDYPIGTLTWGAALIGSRSVESLIKEYEYSLPSLKEGQARIETKLREGKAKRGERYKYAVSEIAAGLKKHILNFYTEEYGDKSDAEKPRFGILVNGYSSGEFFPEQLVLTFPDPSDPKEIREDVDGKPFFGANWFGLTDAIVRLHWGRDDKVNDILAERFKVEKSEIQAILDPLQYPVPFDGMPLQDAIDYAVYLVNVTIGRFRFVIGAPLCGGEIDVAVITPDEFTWIKRKSWSVRNQ